MFSYKDPMEAVEQLEYSDSQYKLLMRIRELGQSVIGPLANEIDQSGEYPYASIDALRKEGITSLAVPARFGGSGGGYNGDVVLLPIALMELASWCSSTAQVLALHNTGVQMVHALANEEQKQFFFEEAVQGQLFASFGSESGNNRFVLTSELLRVKGGYSLHGKKIFATGSPGAKWALWRSVAADIDGSQDERYMMPLVDLTSVGITIIDDWDGIGQRGTGSGQVLADNVFVSERQLIGSPGSYSAVEPFFSAQFNIHFAAQFVGIALGAYREAVAYIHEKSRSWSPTGEAASANPITQLRLGEWSAQLAAAKGLVLRAARLLQASQHNPELQQAVNLAASHAKIAATQSSLQVTSSLFQVMGARAATRSHNFDRYYRNARTLTLHDPIDKHLQLAGQYELGLI